MRFEGSSRSPVAGILLALAALLVSALVLVVYLPTLDHGWAPIDDELNFVDNPHYRGFSAENLGWMWTARHAGHYIPLTWMTLAADFQRSGLDARGYHATQVVLHLGNALLFLALSWRLLRRSDPQARALGSFVATALFALHPLRVESVAWITERRDLLVGFLVLATTLLYLAAVEPQEVEKRAGEHGGRRRTLLWVAASVTFGGALLAKGIAVMLPLALLALDVVLGRADLDITKDWRGWLRRCRGVWFEKLPLFALAFVVVVVTFWAIGPVMVESERVGFEHRLLSASYGLWFYLEKTVLPWSIPFQVPLVRSLDFASDVGVALRGLGFLALFGAACRFPRRLPALGLALFVYGAFVLPVSGLFQAGPQLVAHRYSYLATMPVALWLGGLMAVVAAAAGAVQVARRGRGFGLVALTVAALSIGFGLAYLARAQVALWRDDVTFCRAAVESAPEAWAPVAALARAHLRRGEAPAALSELRAARARSPRLANGLFLIYLEALLLASSEDDQVRDGELAFPLARRAAEATRFQDPAALLALALANAERGDLAVAEQLLASAQALARTGRKREFLPILGRAEREIRARGRFRLGANDWRDPIL